MNQKIVKTRQILVAVSLIFSAAFFVSCEKNVYDPPKLDTTVPVSFKDEIQPIFTSNCTTCHKGSFSPDLTSGKAYESLTKGGYVNTANPESSKIYVKITSSSHTARTSDLQKQKILAWITQGALNN